PRPLSYLFPYTTIFRSHGLEADGHLWQVVGMHQHVATRHVDLVFQCQGDRLARTGMLQLALKGDDGLDLAGLARWQRHDLIALRSEEHTSELQSRENLV